MEHHFSHTKSFRYEVIQGENPKKLLYVLHGYGQLSKYFIRKFKSLPDDIMIVAPEGMHRFYLNGSNGRVGASWMTKEDREIDISDNISWLNALDEKIKNEYGIEEVYLLGFSQGGATAARWQMNGKVSFKAIALWACVFPPDLDLTELKKNKIDSFFIIGSEDEFYSESSQKELCTFYKSIDYNIIKYDGKHDIQSETLDQLIRQMIK